MNDEIEKLREELAEANARRDDMRTALEWANKERDDWRRSSDGRNDECNRIQRALNVCAEERDRLRERCERLANNHEWRVEELAARNKELSALRKERDEARSYKTTMMAACSAFESLEHMVRFELHIPESECVREACQRIYAQLDKVKEDGAQLQAEVNFLRALRKNECEDFSRVCKERDEARAELHASNEQMDFIAKALELEHDDDIEDAVTDMVAETEHARDRIEELRAEVERLKERVTDHAAKFESGLSVLRQERDEARAEVATAAKYCDELAETIRMHLAREIELEAEVERLRAMLGDAREAVREQKDRLADCDHDPDFCTCGEAAKAIVLLAAIDGVTNGDPLGDRALAYRRGAEAMREACARYIEGEDEMFADNGLRALPIPEER